MAKGDDIAAVFEVLEKVFNPETEYEYDEALEELGLATAKVRKTYPNLFKAMKYPSRLENAPVQAAPAIDTSDLIRQLTEAIGAAKSNGNGNGHAPAPAQVVRQAAPVEAPVAVEDTEPVIPSTLYSEWAGENGPSQICSVGQEFYIKWDSQAPMPGIYTTFALKRVNGTGKGRYHILDYVSENVFHIKMVAILPNDG